MLEEADHSPVRLIHILVKNIPCFNDVAKLDNKPLQFYKRAQILVADLWACFGNSSYGNFRDIDKISMFADYRVPQILHSLGCLRYSPSLITKLSKGVPLRPGSRLEIEIRGVSIW